MTIFIFHANIVIANKALVSFRTTITYMFLIIFKLYDLFTKSARLWLHKTTLFMIFKIFLIKFNLAKLTLYFSMSLFIMFFLFRFCNNISTNFALVIVPCTSNFMHSKFCHFYLSLTI